MRSHEGVCLQLMEERRAQDEEESKASEELIQKLLAEEQQQLQEEMRRKEEDERLAKLLSNQLVREVAERSRRGHRVLWVTLSCFPPTELPGEPSCSRRRSGQEEEGGRYGTHGQVSHT